MDERVAKYLKWTGMGVVAMLVLWLAVKVIACL